jgi:hypothetical protein
MQVQVPPTSSYSSPQERSYDGDTGSGGARVIPTGAGVAGMEVRDAAVSAVRRGWPVVPGVCRPDDLSFSRVCPHWVCPHWESGA